VKAGTIIGKCMPRHRADEFRRFLDTVEKNVPADLDVHVVMDNASSHKTTLIRDWFAKRPGTAVRHGFRYAKCTALILLGPGRWARSGT